ncbi:class I SAM-dependent methyltransferase [Exercitatus varius]|uniref:class I SAM-dependent methyltransferase n=1 Tax=Exercitatus varius TaxID=67857 RepID=UPI00294B879A|nr:SAM-dependent methyltransferase [Exercitatus varius]MDG2952067.1 SAM-dependent methyltransferase [Exercitatus varius]MDG2957400.1 SAM-dependent methyltransferase [Exercitatus varius]
MNELKAPPREHSDFIQSANVTALMRALLSEKGGMNPDFLAKEFVSGPLKNLLIDIEESIASVNRRVPGCVYYHLVRTKRFDETLLDWCRDNRGRSQVIILGAGFDSRSIRFNQELKNINVYEVDLEAMLNHKKGIIRNLNVKNKSIYIPINFGKESLLDVFEKNNIPQDLPTLILWEGVSYFLDESTVIDILSSLRTYFYQSVKVVLDYAYRDYINGNLDYFGAPELFKELKEIGEPHVSGIDHNNIDAFAKKVDYKIYRHYPASRLEEIYLPKPLKMHGFHGILELVSP